MERMDFKVIDYNYCKHDWKEICLVRTGMLPFYISPLLQCIKCKEIKLGE